MTSGGFFAKLSELVFRDFGLKLVSLVAALIAYSLVHGVQDAQRTFSIDLVALTPPDRAKRVLTSPLPPRVRVTAHGPKNILDDLHSDDLGTIQVDLRGGADTRAMLTASMVHLPTGVKVEQIYPPWIDLVWEDRVERDLPVQVSVVGSPASGFVVKGALDCQPPTVRVAGPKSQVLVLQHVRADAFDVTGRVAGKHVQVLALDHALDPRVTLDAQTVTATAEITRELTERQFQKIHLQITGQTKAKATPSDVDVRLVCPPEVIRGLRAEQILPQVDIASKEAQGSQSLPVVVHVEQCEAHVVPAEVVVRW